MYEKIEMIRGTSVQFGIKIIDEFGCNYELQEGEYCNFGIKSSVINDEYDLFKKFDSNDYDPDDQVYVIQIAPEETIGLDIGRYYADVGFVSAANEYCMIIPCFDFVISKNITKR